MTWQSTLTQAIPNGQFATTTFKNIFELGYAFDKDETRGLLAGVRDVHVEVASPLAGIHSSIIGYVNLAHVRPFTEPVVRSDLDRMDDNDNRLFGLTAEIMWVPKPAYALTLRTPLYFVRH